MKKGLWILLVLVLAIAVGIYIFFKRTEAPILKGEVELSVNYKDDLKLDIYEPTNQVYTKNPVLVYYHGGAWVSGDKITVNNARFNGAFNALREKGYVVISPTYTLAKFKSSPFPACIADAFDVISWIEKNAEAHNFDTENVGVLGESAGGHLALMVAYADAEKFTKPHNIDLNYVVAAYPPTDLEKLYVDLKELRETVSESASELPSSLQEYFNIDQYLFGFDVDRDTVKANELAQLYSPVNYLNRHLPNTLIIHGNQDRVVPLSQSELLQAKMKSANKNLQFHILDGVDHAFMNATPEQKNQTQKWIADFVNSQYVE